MLVFGSVGTSCNSFESLVDPNTPYRYKATCTETGLNVARGVCKKSPRREGGKRETIPKAFPLQVHWRPRSLPLLRSGLLVVDVESTCAINVPGPDLLSRVESC